MPDKAGIGRITAAAMTKNVASLGRDFMLLHLPEFAAHPRKAARHR